MIKTIQRDERRQLEDDFYYEIRAVIDQFNLGYEKSEEIFINVLDDYYKDVRMRGKYNRG